jgi:hypothetical protein
MSFAEMSHSMLTDRFMLAMIPASKGANGEAVVSPGLGRQSAVTLVCEHQGIGAAGER